MSELPLLILLVFLVVTLAAGIRHSLDVRSLQDYVLSPGYFSTFGLALSIVATEIGSGSILGTLEKVHQSSMVYAYALLGLGYQMLLIAILAPWIFRQGKKLSVGDIIADAYGDTARCFTALLWLLFCTGIMAAQVTAMGRLVSLVLPTTAEFNMIAGAIVIVAYSGYCGIRAVVATDGLQAFVMLTGLLMLLVNGLDSVGGYQALVDKAPSEKLMGLADLGLVGAVALLLSFTLGDLLIPPVVQRVLMARNSRQASISFILAAMLIFPLVIGIGLLGLVAHAMAPSIVPGASFNFILDTKLPEVARSLVVCGTLAAVMSSADSYLNTAGVALAHDLFKPFPGRQFSESQRLLLARISTVLVGAVAVLLSLTGADIMDLMVNAFRCWGPTVAVPLLLALFSRRNRPVQFFLPCFCGLATVISWEVQSLDKSLGLNSLIAGMTMNALISLVLVFLFRADRRLAGR